MFSVRFFQNRHVGAENGWILADIMCCFKRFAPALFGTDIGRLACAEALHVPLLIGTRDNHGLVL